MSEIVPVAVFKCVGCGASNPATNGYCGGCGHQIVRHGDGVSPHPGFGGPRRLLLLSSAAFTVSFVIAAVSFVLIQASGAVSVGLGGPIVNKLLDAANVTSVRVPGSPSDAVSLLMIGSFLLATLAAATSAVGVAAGGTWLLVRWRNSDGPSRVATAGAKGLEDAKPKLVDAGVRSLAVAEQVKDGAAGRYEEMAPVVRRAAGDSRAKFDAEVAPRVSSGIRRGTEKYKGWVKARRERRTTPYRY